MTTTDDPETEPYVSPTNLADNAAYMAAASHTTSGKSRGPWLSIVTEYLFEAAHRLPNHDGKCRNLHGHSYRLQIEVSGLVVHHPGHPKDGMLVDFGDLKTAIKYHIWERLDHKYLNEDLPDIGTPTAENICIWIKSQMPLVMKDFSDARWEAIRLWETSTTYVELRR